jgi:hypothetical protein
VAKPGADSISVAGRLRLAPTTARFDPALDDMTISVYGENDTVVTYTVSAGDPNWRRAGKTFKWRSPTEFPTRTTISVTPKSGRYAMSVKGFDFEHDVEHPTSVKIVLGDASGTLDRAWRGTPTRYRF